MPLVRISVPVHLSTEKVRVLADAVHAALVQACNVPVNDRFQLISRFADDDRIIDPTFPNVDRTADASIVEITLLEGHDDSRKRLLYREIALGAAAGGFSTDDIFVALLENARVDWSPGGGIAYG
jgi:hypothetical protein